jgi:hypothetical protein
MPGGWPRRRSRRSSRSSTRPGRPGNSAGVAGPHLARSAVVRSTAPGCAPNRRAAHDRSSALSAALADCGEPEGLVRLARSWSSGATISGMGRGGFEPASGGLKDFAGRSWSSFRRPLTVAPGRRDSGSRAAGLLCVPWCPAARSRRHSRTITGPVARAHVGRHRRVRTGPGVKRSHTLRALSHSGCLRELRPSHKGLGARSRAARTVVL